MNDHRTETRQERRLAEQQRGKGQRWKQILALTTLMLLFVSVTGLTYFWLGGDSFEKPKRTTPRENGITNLPGKVNILVLGVDERRGDTGRSDTMILVTVDTATKKVSLLSIPRDTRVRIPGRNWDKINHAFAFGRQQLAQKAVEDLLGIPIDYYVVVNIDGFNRIIDAIGGVDIDVEKRMYYNDPYDDNGGLFINLQPGQQHLDGRTAIQYVRYRDEEGDIGRIERQQKFLRAVLQQVSSPNVLPQIPAIIRELAAAITTDMSGADMLNLAKLLADASRQGLDTASIAGAPRMMADISYWIPDIALLRDYVARVQGLGSNPRYQAESRTLANQYLDSLPITRKLDNAPVVAPTKPVKPGIDGSTADKGKSSSGKLRITVVNASGISDAGGKVAAALRSDGHEVTGVSNQANTAAKTTVLARTYNNAVLDKLSHLPFHYVLQVQKDESKADQVTVTIGSDYAR
ncbi:MAG TPA: LCP family protein [Patescibacteria group bacterium]|nr:LCP family protein [Patescibacteria group bacterium]